MTIFRQKYQVESARLPGWDYAAAGWYFVTICTRDQACFFGEVVDGEMHLSAVGEIAHGYWSEIPNHFRNTSLDEFVVMPNHVDGIVVIERVETRHVVSLPNKFGPLKPGSLQAIIHGYKSAVTRRYRKNGYDQFSWQPRFYDHIIRDEESLDRIREYVLNNPMRWESDNDNPANLYMRAQNARRRPPLTPPELWVIMPST